MSNLIWGCSPDLRLGGCQAGWAPFSRFTFFWLRVRMNYLLVFLSVILAVLMVVGALGASRLLAPHHPGGRKDHPYECGEETIGPSWVQFNVGYYLFALLFLVFDVEAAFLYPWAMVFKQVGAAGLFEGLAFVFVLVVGLAYAWKKGALEWV